MYTDPTPSSAFAQVELSSQSNGRSPEPEPIRTGRPRAVSRSATRRPVFPVPFSTSVGFVSCVCDTVRQLGEVRRRWDPDGLFRANFTLAAA